MPAGLTEDRAGIEAGPAADAEEALGKRRIAQAATAIIQQDEMAFKGTVDLAGSAWGMEQAGVNA